MLPVLDSDPPHLGGIHYTAQGPPNACVQGGILLNSRTPFEPLIYEMITSLESQTRSKTVASRTDTPKTRDPGPTTLQTLPHKALITSDKGLVTIYGKPSWAPTLPVQRPYKALTPPNAKLFETLGCPEPSGNQVWDSVPLAVPHPLPAEGRLGGRSVEFRV